MLANIKFASKVKGKVYGKVKEKVSDDKSDVERLNTLKNKYDLQCPADNWRLLKLSQVRPTDASNLRISKILLSD